MLDTRASLAFLSDVNALQYRNRTGYQQAGIPQPESVAEHSYSVAWFALLIATAEGANVDKVLKMALLHDLPEARLGDFDHPMVEGYLGAPSKQTLEDKVLADQLDLLPSNLGDDLAALWQELSAGETIEARVVHDADKLQMMHRISEYQKIYSLDFADFWRYADTHDWLPSSAKLYQALPRLIPNGPQHAK